jgi:GH15 family glucan-1,4-alpha-glucosidase
MSALPPSGSFLPSIQDYGLIGDCRSAALVSRDGSIDWLCLPRFDSPSVFGALLDADRGGRFRIRPPGPVRVERRYLPDTNILETTFIGAEGACVLRDLMPVRSEEAKRHVLTPEHQVLREIEGLEGEIDVEVLYEPRPDYARSRPALVDKGACGLWCLAGRGQLVLLSELPLRLGAGGASASGVRCIRAGDRFYLSLTYEEDAPATLPPLGRVAAAQVAETADWWRAWAGGTTYAGPYREAVVRSALTLKLLTYAPSGAVVAAPTTSLPEKIGGPRNWDYRYCWLRDASFTIRALLALGFDREAEAFLGWMLHATRLSWPELQVLYNVYGETRLPERELGHLQGHAGSQPVRIGNDAHHQLQLDVYGEVIDAAARFVPRSGRFDRDTARFLAKLGETVCKRWREPDDGIWEGRSGRYHHTHSKVLCWVALDRLLTMHADGRLPLGKAVRHFRTERDALAATIEAEGYNHDIGSYTRTLNGDELDASLLLLPLYGYVEAERPRMRSTLARILEKLGSDGLVYRYDASTPDGLPPGEGAFGICSFWAVECMALAGDLAGATTAFERLLACQNDLGLLAEEMDPETGEPLGNFPQAFTHIGLINAALTLARYEGRDAEAAGDQPAADIWRLE